MAQLPALMAELTASSHTQCPKTEWSWERKCRKIPVFITTITQLKKSKLLLNSISDGNKFYPSYRHNNPRMKVRLLLNLLEWVF